MARPLTRRTRAEAPDADEYTGRKTERRPRRRGELPSRKDEPAADDGLDLPTTKRALGRLSDDEWDELVERLDLPKLADEDEVWEAIEAAQEDAEPEDEEEEKPTRRASRRSRTSEEEKPARRSRRAEPEEDEDEEEEKPRARRGERRASRDDDESPRRSLSRNGTKDDGEGVDTKRKASRGFKGFAKVRKETGGFADDFKLTEDEALVKFLEDEPFATYGEHGLFKELSEGQRVWTCLAPDDCPVCNTGHQARPVALWNVVYIPEEGDPQVKVLKAGPMLEKIIEKKASLKSGPMSREYYSMSQTAGKNDGPPTISVEVVRERDLDEDWEVEPFTDDELAEFLERGQDEDFVKFPTVKAMRDVARAMRERD